MKGRKIGVFTALVLAAVTLVAYGFFNTAFTQELGKLTHKELFWGQPITWMLESKTQLGLSEAQVAELESLRASFEEVVLENQKQLTELHKEIMAFVESGASDMAAIEAKIRQQEQLSGDLQVSRFRAILEAEALLTQEQQAKCRELMTAAPGEATENAPQAETSDHCHDNQGQSGGPDDTSIDT